MSRIFLKPNSGTTSVSWTNTALWEGGVAPASGDEAHLLNAALRFDLTLNHAGIKLAKLVTYDTFIGSLGGTGTNALQLSFDVGHFHVQAVSGTKGNGSPLINLNHGSNGAEIVNFGSRTAPGTDRGLMPSRFIGSDSNTTSLTVIGGYVAYGFNSLSETGWCPTVNVSGGGAHVVIGPGITLATVNVGAGELDVNSAVPVLNLNGGIIRTNGDWQMGTATLSGGTAVFNHRKTAATEVQNLKMQGGKMDLTQRGDAFAATATTIRAGSIAQFSATQFTPGTLTLDFNGMRSFTGSLSA